MVKLLMKKNVVKCQKKRHSSTQEVSLWSAGLLLEIELDNKLCQRWETLSVQELP